MKTIFDKYKDLKEITNDMLLPEVIDHQATWENYCNEDPGAICGACTKFVSDAEVRMTNALLHKQLGALNQLAPWGIVLDIGAGVESLRLLLSQYHQYYPVDVVKHTKDTLLLNGDGQLPFGDKVFDYVYCSNVFQHLHTTIKKKYLEEMFRVVKDEGRVFLTCSIDESNLGPRFNDRRYCVTDKYFVEIESRSTIESLISNAGFSIMTRTSRVDDMASWWLAKNKETHENSSDTNG